MYIEISKILDQHGIRYFMHYGTAIGALRHNGFIPWDDDIDIVVWREDLENVNRILSEELNPQRFYYHIPSADSHPHVILKTENFAEDLKNKNAPFIDIFVMDRYPNTKGKQILSNIAIWGFLIGLTGLDYIKTSRCHGALSKIPRWFERRASNLSKTDTDLVTVYSTTFKREIFPSKYFENTFKHKFETIEAPLPEGIDTVLTSYYGDYMTPPEEGHRSGAAGYPCNVFKDYLRDSKN